jgi:formate dehydrogenase (coenzyme F420) beta subunit
MDAYITKIKEISGRLLKDGTVDAVIGFSKGTLPTMSEPCMIKSADNVEELVWDSTCRVNLCNYLTNRKEKLAIVAKGCDSRNIVTHIIENKIKRDQIFIIGVPCKGMTNKDTGEIQDNCSTCTHRNPVIYDELVADLVEEQTDVDKYADIKKVEAMSTEDKWDYFTDLYSTCTRCYACRNACPLCYCPTCFVDESKPQWVGKANDPMDIKTYHLLRAYHCAGRCTDCGSCEAACPQNIKVRQLTKKLEKDCFELYGWEAGLTLDQRPPLDTFKVDDKEDFIK